MRFDYSEKQAVQDFLERLDRDSEGDSKEIARQCKDSYCVYSRLDHAFHMMESFEVAFLDNYAMRGDIELWKQAYRVHTEFFNLYQMLGEKFSDMDKSNVSS